MARGISWRQQAVLRYKEYRALCLLLNTLSKEDRLAMEYTLTQLDSLPRDQLKGLDAEVKDQIVLIRKEFGVTATRADLELLMKPIPAPRGDALYMSKHALDRWVAHYEKRLAIYPQLPPHARIRVCVFNPEQPAPGIEIFVLEASLFEDMAALWNSAFGASEGPVSQSPTSPSIDAFRFKQSNALMRATAKAAFNLLEGYLNGLAFDILATTDVPPHDEAKLREWDETRGRPSPLTLRDKILQYSRIAVAAQHPPLSEQNCAEVAKTLQFQDSLRHSLIHPTPQARGVSFPEPTREEYYWNINKDDVAELCDCVIALIRKIDETVGRRFGSLGYWIHDRMPNGRFGDAAFV